MGMECVVIVTGIIIKHKIIKALIFCRLRINCKLQSLRGDGRGATARRRVETEFGSKEFGHI